MLLRVLDHPPKRLEPARGGSAIDDAMIERETQAESVPRHNLIAHHDRLADNAAEAGKGSGVFFGESDFNW